MPDLVWKAFFSELVKIASNRSSDPLRVPGTANGTPMGLAKPFHASGQNLAKFQAAGPGKAMVTGASTTAHNPSSLISAGSTGAVGIPAPLPVQ
jgi:hypothetical protein